MLVSAVSRLVCAWFAFALPSYATYKALAHSAPVHTLHALSAYWAVLGVFVVFEQVFGFLLSWLPFYCELRTAFLLYISLPQTNGSAYVFKTCLAPWFSRNELQIDHALASAQANAIAYCRTRIAILVDHVRALLTNTPVSGQAPPLALWTTYGTSVLAAFAKDTSDAHVSTSPHEQLHHPNSTN